MTLLDRAYALAEERLAESLPRRWNHVRGVARQARTLHDMAGDDAEVLEAAAILHDIGYAPDLVDTDLHPLDGARFLRGLFFNERVVSLVAHHTCAVLEAEERGLRGDLESEFARDDERMHDALIYCDMTTSPYGGVVDAGSRIEEIAQRYGPESIVGRFILRARPELLAAVDRTTRRLMTSPDVR